MNKLVDAYIDGEKHKALIVHVFAIEGREFCIYAIPKGNGEYGIKCGKKIGNEVVDIEDENERVVVENITKTILKSQKKEAFLHMNEEESRFTIMDDNGKERDASIIGEYEVDGKNYLLYAIDENEKEAGLYLKKVIYDEKGEVKDLVSVSDPKEKEIVFPAIIDYINSEVGEE